MLTVLNSFLPSLQNTSKAYYFLNQCDHCKSFILRLTEHYKPHNILMYNLQNADFLGRRCHVK